MPAFADSDAQVSFWRNHDAQMFEMRLRFLLTTLFIYPAFGFMDWLVGGENIAVMLYARALAFVILLIAAIRFAAPGSSPDTRERLIKGIAFATIGCELLLIMLGSPEATQYHHFGLCVIIGLGALMLVPRFRTTAVVIGVTMTVYLLTLYWQPGSNVSKTINASFNLMIAGAVLVGSFERERLARMQVVMSHTLERTNRDLIASRQEAVKARDTAIMANRLSIPVQISSEVPG